MSGGGGLTNYTGGDDDEGSDIVATEGTADRAADIREIVEDLRSDDARGVARGETNSRRRQVQGSNFERRVGIPKDFSAKSQAAWAQVPKSVKNDVHKALGQRDEYAAYLRPLAPFIRLCHDNGTNLQTALQKYNALENLMVRDPVEGVAQICSMLGIDPRAMINAAIARLNNPGMYTSAPQPQRQQQAPEAAAVDQMARDPRFPHFMQLRQRMSQLISNGASDNLEHAYMLAFNERSKGITAVARARAASKAVSGAPGSGQVPTAGGPASDSRRDLIRAAIAAQRGEV
jgi:hypothetical protein